MSAFLVRALLVSTVACLLLSATVAESCFSLLELAPCDGFRLLPFERSIEIIGRWKLPMHRDKGL